MSGGHQEILVSIVTPTWNLIKADRLEMLKKCVKSVSLIPVPHEHVIIDGASTDGTLAELQGLEKRISSLRLISEPDTGIYDAMNKGVGLAWGKFVYFLGSDDLIVNQNAFRQALEWAQNKCVDMVVSPVMFKGKDGREKLEVVYRGLFCENPYPHQGVMMTKSLIMSLGGFNTSLKICADYDLILRAHLRGVRHCMFEIPYARFYGFGVSSELFSQTWHENLMVAGMNLGMSDSERQYAEKKELYHCAFV